MVTQAKGQDPQCSTFIRKAADVAKIVLESRIAKIKAKADVGQRQIGCMHCCNVAHYSEFRAGRGRQYGQHPEHHYCPNCGLSIEWAMFYDVDSHLIKRDL
ncbi:MAG: hypothetical protein M1343_10050 [Chloroflexi bacterium]|nr:hypothetical protein [Chloroflexota bacterium]